jgi:excisionase family DNA binding protein
MKAFLTVPEVAKLLKVNRSTVLRWIGTGIIQGASKLPGTKQWRIPLSSYEEFHKLHYENREL